eukprot:81641-Chlamydomonas_euryale.AAC.30
MPKAGTPAARHLRVGAAPCTHRTRRLGVRWSLVCLEPLVNLLHVRHVHLLCSLQSQAINVIQHSHQRGQGVLLGRAVSRVVTGSAVRTDAPRAPHHSMKEALEPDAVSTQRTAQRCEGQLRKKKEGGGQLPTQAGGGVD